MITAQQMRELEQQAVKKGISLGQLMENAGRAVFQVIHQKYDVNDKQVVIFAGTGNNAGDGFVVARYCAEFCPVTVLFFGDERALSEEAEENYNKIKEYITILKITESEELQRFHFQTAVQYIFIDALLGTGAYGELREPVKSAVALFNQSKGIKVAIDIPSGMNPDTGEVTDDSCDVDIVTCFHDLKQGLEKIKEKVVVVDIGI